MAQTRTPAPRQRPAVPQIDRSIPFVETHYHLWELERFPYRWLSGTCQDEYLGDYRAICRDMLPNRVQRDFYGQNVTHRIHIEADSQAADPVDETSWLDGLPAAEGRPDALVVMCDLAAERAEHELARHLQASSLVRGVRIREHPTTISSTFQRGYAALARYGLSYELSASPGRLTEARAHLAANPEVQVMVGHAGFPIRRDAAYLAMWQAGLVALAELEHVACKVSGFSTIDHEWTVASLRPLVLTCIEAFGVERIVFGTDWPVSGLFASYFEQVDAYRLILADAGFSRDDRARMLHGNAERLYRL